MGVYIGNIGVGKVGLVVGFEGIGEEGGKIGLFEVICVESYKIERYSIKVGCHV